jgi:hypothetical protein
MNGVNNRKAARCFSNFHARNGAAVFLVPSLELLDLGPQLNVELDVLADAGESELPTGETAMTCSIASTTRELI